MMKANTILDDHRRAAVLRHGVRDGPRHEIDGAPRWRVDYDADRSRAQALGEGLRRCERQQGGKNPDRFGHCRA
jgi:hypothetical protein